MERKNWIRINRQIYLNHNRQVDRRTHTDRWTLDSPRRWQLIMLQGPEVEDDGVVLGERQQRSVTSEVTCVHLTTRSLKRRLTLSEAHRFRPVTLQKAMTVE